MIKKIIKRILISRYNKFNSKNNRIDVYMNYSILENFIVIEKGCIIDNRLEFIGRGIYINKDTRINSCKRIGRYCSISHGVKIGVGSHPKEWVSTSPLFYSPERGVVKDLKYDNRKEDKDVIISNDVWIGCNAIIMPGISIGNGAIVAAGSIVTKSVPDYAIVAGVPAKIVGYRFEKEVREKLIESQWWDLNLDNYIEHMRNPITFLKIINN